MITLIVNPTAGNGRSKKIAISATERLNKKNIPYQIIETTAPGTATELARQAAASYQTGDYLLAVGGDGTFLEVVQGILGSGMPVAAIPAGTGNDFLKSLQVPKDPMEALEHVLAAKTRMIDVGEINQQVFANECGAGFDVSVLDYAEKAKKHFHGLLPYLWGVLRTLLSYRAIPMEIIADGKEVFNGDCLVFSVANGQYIGGGIHISPTADPQSGKLELIIIKACSRLRMMSYLPGLLGGKILKFKDTVVHCRANQISVRPTGSLNGFRVNVDGEIRDLPYCEFTVRPSALPVHM